MSNERNLEQELAQICKDIKPLREGPMDKARCRMNNLTKPPGSLGRLEDLAVKLAGIHGDFFPTETKKQVVVMAADHGVTDEGVSAFPGEVTLQMVANFVDGGAAINVFSRLEGAEVKVVDLGVSTDPDLPGVKKVRIRPGTANFCREAAMSREEALQAILSGVECAREASLEGVRVLATGEMGIGNTTASSAVMAALTGYEPSLVVGRGTGLDDDKLLHKQEVVDKGLKLHRPDPDDPLGVMSAVGGLEIAALAGLILGGASRGIPVIVDGFISSVAALTATKLVPEVSHYLIPSHLSEESGHALLLDYLNLQPYFSMRMRLGEGTGAVLAMNLVEAAARITVEMATFEDAGVSQEEEEKEEGEVEPVNTEGETQENGDIPGSSRGDGSQ